MRCCESCEVETAEKFCFLCGGPTKIGTLLAVSVAKKKHPVYQHSSSGD